MSEPLWYNGQRALVTGGSGDLGRVIAVRLARLGCDVALVGRRRPTLEVVAAEIEAADRKAAVFECDVTDDAAVEAMVAEAEGSFGQLDIVVNNAGGALFLAALAEVRAGGMRKALALNLEGAFFVAQAVGRRMRERGAGAIVNIASVSGVRPIPGMGHYGAAKAGLLMLTRSLAVEWASSGVRVNAVVPGYVRTEGWDRFREHSGFEAATSVETPSHEWVSPDDVAWAVAFLASDFASGITGAALPVDAGMGAA